MSCAPLLDWVAKLKLLEGYRARDGLSWDDHRLAAIDIQWADVRPEKGLVHRLRDRGCSATSWTPRRSRRPRRAARGHPRLVPRRVRRRFHLTGFSASWDSVVFDVPGRASLQRVPILEPERGTRAQVGTLLEQSAGRRRAAPRAGHARVAGTADRGAEARLGRRVLGRAPRVQGRVTRSNTSGR